MTSRLFAVFDIETRIDKALLNRVFYRGANLTDDDAYARFRDEQRGGEFPPVTLHTPISIAVGDVSEDYVLRAVESLAPDDYSEERLAREFWRRAEHFDGALVSFNGRGFDLPVLELAALRYGIAAPRYFNDADGARARYGGRHFDVYDYLTNYGARGLRGGLDLLLKLSGLPGKQGVDGAAVQTLFDEGRLDAVHRYCRADVVQTYFLFLRVELIRGRIDAQRYQQAFDASAGFLRELEEPSA